ncbi:DHHA1 domain [Micractinium conductrix]|uniref:DHHA1 domain n=1 Tax=Micractinium conductrix TaxID=554055 RepID=A0A2P6VAZ6_9CHLO|nr:DHHA1 domain [Micractinium conductrix]|eukprot:PSC71276.1 DHHA1 domain [Micractinium conductrix]
MAPRNLCLYHYPCPDGVFAALAVHLAHRARGQAVEYWPNTVYAPLTLEDLRLQGVVTAYLVDFSGGPGFARSLAQRARRVVVLDHHKTAAAELCDPQLAEGLPGLEVHFDMERSGATVSYDFFRPEGLTPEQQQLFKYIEDADLWRWRLPDSKAFTAGLASLRLEFDARKNPGVWDQLLAQTPQGLIARGKPILEGQARLVAGAVAQAFVVQLGGGDGAGRGWGRCLAVRVGPELSSLRSQLGNELAAASAAQGLRAMAVVAYLEPAMSDDSKMKCSVRSIGESEDTTEISEAYGGGGHRNASSFITDAAVFERWRQA